MRTRRLMSLGGIQLSVSVEDSIAKKLQGMRRRLSGDSASARAPEPAPPASETVSVPRSPEEARLLARIRDVEWYHSIELAPGVVTPGFFDHRPHLSNYHLPASLAGQRVLDVATYDGFWAFEMEKRGAEEIVALDIETFSQIDLAPARRAAMSEEELNRKVGKGFEIARETLQSRVNRRIGSVYDLSGGGFPMFDLVFCGDLLLHLCNPIRALQGLRRVTSGSALICELFDPQLDERGNGQQLLSYHGGSNDYVWWTFGRQTLETMIRDAGFSSVECLSTFNLIPRGYRESPPHALFRASP